MTEDRGTTTYCLNKTAADSIMRSAEEHRIIRERLTSKFGSSPPMWMLDGLGLDVSGAILVMLARVFVEERIREIDVFLICLRADMASYLPSLRDAL